jgi:hypothetical protein
MKATVQGFADLLEAVPSLHILHDIERPWPQTNCSVDLMIELVAAYGFDPTWMLAFTLTQDFEGDHFTFFKVPSEDLEALYGLSIQELAVWDDLEGHILEQLGRGHVVLVEVDGYYLPDTRGVTYRENHGKTSIGVFSLDQENRQLAYFHNETRGVLTGDDYDGALQKLPGQSALLMPYCEVIKTMGAASKDPAGLAMQLLRRHFLRRPPKNPFRAYEEVFAGHLAKLGQRGPAYFHAYAFNTVRQVGANFGLLESFLLRMPGDAFTMAATSARRLAEEAKVLQFRLARAVMRSNFDGLAAIVATLVQTYDQLMCDLTPLGHAAQT